MVPIGITLLREIFTYLPDTVHALTASAVRIIAYFTKKLLLHQDLIGLTFL